MKNVSEHANVTKWLENVKAVVALPLQRHTTNFYLFNFFLLNRSTLAASSTDQLESLDVITALDVWENKHSISIAYVLNLSHEMDFDGKRALCSVWSKRTGNESQLFFLIYCLGNMSRGEGVGFFLFFFSDVCCADNVHLRGATLCSRVWRSNTVLLARLWGFKFLSKIALVWQMVDAHVHTDGKMISFLTSKSCLSDILKECGDELQGIFFFLLLWKWSGSSSRLDNLLQPPHLIPRQAHCCGAASVWRSGQRWCTHPAHIMTRPSRCTSLLYVSMLAAWVPRLRLIAASAAKLDDARPVLPRCRCLFSCATPFVQTVWFWSTAAAAMIMGEKKSTLNVCKINFLF